MREQRVCEHPIPVPPSSSRSRPLAAVPIFTRWPPPLHYCTCIYRSAGTIQSHLPSWPTTVHRLCRHLMSLGRGPLHPTRVRFRRRQSPVLFSPSAKRPRQILCVGMPVPRRGSTGRESTFDPPIRADALGRVMPRASPTRAPRGRRSLRTPCVEVVAPVDP